MTNIGIGTERYCSVRKNMIPVSKPWITELEKRYVAEAMDSSWISSIGPFIERFEAAFAAKIGVKHAISTNTGTSACHAALAVLGFRPRDEIVVPAVTFVATANAVKYCGCEPIFADIDKNTWNMDVAGAESLIGPRTVAVFAVHLYGNMCNMDKMRKMCTRNSLILVEDACEALGGTFGSVPAGGFGKTAAFSFYGNKTLTTGEGGMVVTDDDELYEKIKMFKGQGQTDRYYHPIIGHNYRMTNIQAALGLAQVERMDEILVEKQRVFEKYASLLRQVPGVIWPQLQQNSMHSYWAISIMVPRPAEAMEKLAAKGIDARPVFWPLSDLPPYRQCRGSLRCPHSASLGKFGITLPSYAELVNKDISKVCDVVLKHAEERKGVPEWQTLLAG